MSALNKGWRDETTKKGACGSGIDFLVPTVNVPVIASAATFASYVLVGEENFLGSAITFTVFPPFFGSLFAYPLHRKPDRKNRSRN